MNTKNQFSPLDITYIGLFAALIAICSWISIPATVPFTLQTFAIFTAIGILGGKRSTMAIVVYILMGAIGLPVFSGFTGGIGRLFGNTGGYIIGFLFSAVTVWIITHFFGHSTPVMLIAMFAGLIVCYAFGTAWFMALYMKSTGTVSLGVVLGWCVTPFIIPDTIKIILAFLVSKNIRRYIKL